jgi:hypothetical protein
MSDKKTKKIKKYNKHNKQKGGTDIIPAINDVIYSIKDLGKSIFVEIKSITNIKNDIDSVSARTSLPSVNGPSNVSSPY